MDTIFFKLTFCLSLAFAEFTTKNGQWTSQSPSTVQDVFDNTTKGTSLNSPDQSMATLTTVIPDTIVTSMADDNTSTTVTNSSHAQTLQSTTALKPSKSTLTASTAATATQTHSESHTHDSTTTTTAAATTNSSVVTTTLKSTQGARLNISERNLTITFSVMLGLFALALIALKINKWSHKLQFLHEPLHNTEDLTSSTANPDTLRGLSDGHPIYDNVPPPVRHDEAQFSLEFLH